MSKTLLLVAPLEFYGFSKTLKVALESSGYKVSLINDEYPKNTLGRVLGKLGILTPLRHFTFLEFRRQLGGRSDPFDCTLIIKGRGLSCKVIKFLRGVSKRLVAYNFDSFKFNPSPRDWMHEVDQYYTFDIVDARAHSVPLVHLFSAAPVLPDLFEKDIDASFIMKNHSERLSYIDKINAILPADATRYIYVYEPSWLSAVLVILRTPRLYYRYWRHIHFKPLPYESVINYMARSKITVDYAHPSQSGITIRCFEAKSIGACIVTNNLHTCEHPFFRDGSVAHITLNDNAASARDTVKELLKKRSARHHRSVNQFIAELLDD